MMKGLSIDKYLIYNLDILFVALNPPVQSNFNGHCFSGKQSGFFNLLHESGLIVESLDKLIADEEIFGGNNLNYKNYKYGVVDLVSEVVETNSGKVKIEEEHVKSLIGKIIKYNPKIVCIIHSKIRKKINKTKDERKMENSKSYGNSGKLLKECDTIFFMQYFPNGNNIPKKVKIKIFN